jgi:integrase
VIVWLGGLLALVVIATVARRRFAATAVLGTALALLAFSLSDPDRRVAERNVDRWRETGRLDVAYLRGLSADAVPPLVSLPSELREQATASLRRRLADGDPWSSANRSRAEARRLLVAQRRSLFELQWQSDGASPRRQPLAVSHVTLKQWLIEWLEVCVGRGLRPTTISSYRTMVNLHVVGPLAETPLASVQPHDLNLLYSRMLRDGRCDGRRGLSARTVRYLHTILKKAFADAVRRCELLGLRWRDVDIVGKQFHVVQALVEGGHRAAVSRPKTNRSRRLVARRLMETRSSFRGPQESQSTRRVSAGSRGTAGRRVRDERSEAACWPAPRFRGCRRASTG